MMMMMMIGMMMMMMVMMMMMMTTMTTTMKMITLDPQVLGGLATAQFEFELPAFFLLPCLDLHKSSATPPFEHDFCVTNIFIIIIKSSC